jgi:hypothetical protein
MSCYADDKIAKLPITVIVFIANPMIKMKLRYEHPAHLSIHAASRITISHRSSSTCTVADAILGLALSVS